MYKSSFLSHLARVTRQQPFFTQNVNGANSTALSLVKPKLGVATEKAYFSSWGANGHNASNATGSSISQPVLIAITNDDNQAWERELGVHRNKFRSIAGIRRYSTGTQTATENNSESGTIFLRPLEAPEDSAGDDAAASGNSDEHLGQETNGHLTEPDEVQHVRKYSDIDRRLIDLYLSQKYVALLEEFDRALDSDVTLSTISFNKVFQALTAMERTVELEHDHHVVIAFANITSFLNYYAVMLEKAIEPNESTYGIVLSYLVGHAKDARNHKRILAAHKFVLDTPQAAFLEKNQGSLRAAQEIDVVDIMLQIFRASNSARAIKYRGFLLNQMISACALQNKVDEAIELFDHFEKTGVRRSGRSYKALLKVFAKAKDMSGAVECFNSWKSECQTLPPHDFAIIYDAMVRCFFSIGDVDGGLKFFNSAIKESRGDLSYCYINVIRSLSQLGMFEEAFDFVEQNRSETPEDYSRALGILVLEACLQDKFDIAQKYFEHVTVMKAFDENANASWSYLAVLLSEGQLDSAKSFVLNCIRDGIDLRVTHLSSLCSKYLAAGRVDDAFEVAQFVGSRRAITVKSEMNLHKIGLFVSIFLKDLMRLNLVDGKNTPRIIQVLYMLGRSSEVTNLVDFLDLVRSSMSLDDWLVHPGVLDQFCLVVCTILRRDCEPLNTDSEYASQYLTWLMDTIASLNTKQTASISASSLQEIADLAQPLGLNDKLESVTKAMSSTSLGSVPDGVAQLPPPRAVFLQIDHDAINSILTIEVAKALDGFQPRGRPMNNYRISHERIMRLIESSSTLSQSLQGEVYLKAVLHFSRVSRADYMQEILDLAIKVFPNILRSSDMVPAAMAILYDTAIVAFNELHDNENAQVYHDKIIDLGFVPSANAYASFIAKMNENIYRDTATRARFIFEEAMKFGVQPNEYLYNTVIGKMAKARRNTEALAMFDEMKSIGLSPNGVTYGTVINSCCRVGYSARAEELLAEMERLPRQHSRIAPYNTLIQHFVQVKKDRAKAFHYWDRLRARAIPPTAHSYRLLIEAHGHLTPADPVAAESVLGLMQAARIPTEAIHHAAMIHMYGTVLHDLEAANTYLTRIMTRGGPDGRKILPNDIIYQSIIEAHVKADDYDGMQGHLMTMKEHGVQMNAYITNLAIEGCGKKMEVDRAREFFDALPTDGAGSLGKEPSTYEAMIRAYMTCQQPEQAAEILKLLKQQQYPDAVVHRVTALLENHAE